jgi:DNA replication ATP-dependent helicase Dna2
MVPLLSIQLQFLEKNPTFRDWKASGLEISTIDRYQGRDKPVIIISFVRSNANGSAGKLLNDFRRLNVAVSRAKEKLMMVGSYSTLHRGSSVLRPVLEKMNSRNQIEVLPENALL